MNDISLAAVYSVLLWSRPRTHSPLLLILCSTILGPNLKLWLCLRVRLQAVNLWTHTARVQAHQLLSKGEHAVTGTQYKYSLGQESVKSWLLHGLIENVNPVWNSWSCYFHFQYSLLLQCKSLWKTQKVLLALTPITFCLNITIKCEFTPWRILNICECVM